MKHQPDIIWSLKIGHLRIIFIVNNDKTLFYSRKQNKSLILSFLDDRIKKQLGFLCLIFFSQIISFSLRYKLPPLCGMDRWRNWYRFFFIYLIRGFLFKIFLYKNLIDYQELQRPTMYALREMIQPIFLISVCQKLFATVVPLSISSKYSMVAPINLIVSVHHFSNEFNISSRISRHIVINVLIMSYSICFKF